MGVSHGRSKRLPSGAIYKPYRKKRHYECGREPSLTRIGENVKLKLIRTRGGNKKFCLLRVNKVNVYDLKTKRCELVKIKGVIENPANRHFVRRNIITKGCIVDTEKGKAKVTSRPGQHGVVNAVLV